VISAAELFIVGKKTRLLIGIQIVNCTAVRHLCLQRTHGPNSPYLY